MKKFKVSSFRPGEPGSRKVLGDLEADIMDLIWERDVVSVREIHAVLERNRGIAYTTVMTVMGRLSDKGILRKEREGKHYLYSAAVTKAEFSQTMLASMLGGIKEDFGRQALAFFVDGLTEDDETLDELERLIQEKRKQF